MRHSCDYRDEKLPTNYKGNNLKKDAIKGKIQWKTPIKLIQVSVTNIYMHLT